MNTGPARGMRDFLPEDVRRRQYVIDVVRRVYERYGFEPLETPALENIETLTGKYGEEGNQLIYKVLKRGEGEATGQADLALRYDLTVPLARVVADNRGKLPRFFKRYQIQPVWRADRPARGRFREFYQCDVDAIGSTSPVVEVEMICGGQRSAAGARLPRLRRPAEPPRAADRDARRCRHRGGEARRRADRDRQAGQDRARRRDRRHGGARDFARGRRLSAPSERAAIDEVPAGSARPRRTSRRSSRFARRRRRRAT